VHELSIALNLIDIACDEAERLGNPRIGALHLKLGKLSGVDKEALTFSYDIACEGTALAGSRLVIEEVPVIVHCAACNEDVAIESIQAFFCPVCGEMTPEVVQGKEMNLVAMEIT
jgi:hydrogenase nickel incorporation protein HypA/HybF